MLEAYNRKGRGLWRKIAASAGAVLVCGAPVFAEAPSLKITIDAVTLTEKNSFGFMYKVDYTISNPSTEPFCFYKRRWGNPFADVQGEVLVAQKPGEKFMRPAFFYEPIFNPMSPQYYVSLVRFAPLVTGRYTYTMSEDFGAAPGAEVLVELGAVFPCAVLEAHGVAGPIHYKDMNSWPDVPKVLEGEAYERVRAPIYSIPK